MSSPTDTRWSVGRRAPGCAGCATEFHPGGPVVSALYPPLAGDETPVADAKSGSDDDSDSPRFERLDWCPDCFGESAGEGTRAAAQGTPFSWWAGIVPVPEPRKPTFDLGLAAEFLARLLAEGSPERASLRYLLALLLMRKKAVKVVDQFTDERGDVMIVQLGGDDRDHEILCPEIGAEEAESLREELGRLFDI